MRVRCHCGREHCLPSLRELQARAGPSLEEESDFATDRPRPSALCRLLAGIGIVTFGVLLVLGIAALHRATMVPRLPPRAAESTAAKYDEVAEVFGQEALDSDDKEEARIRELFEAYRRALEAKDAAQLGESYDFERMYQEARRLGAFAGIPREEERRCIEILSRSLPEFLAATVDPVGFDRFEIKTLE